MKICLVSAFNLAGGIGKEIQGVERISSVTVMVSYMFSRKLPCLSLVVQAVSQHRTETRA